MSWTVYLSGEIHSDWRQQLIDGASALNIAVIRFGDKFKQWNAAFDAGGCAALGKPYITLHDENIIHPLKEVDAQAMAWAKTPEQVVEILRYVTVAT